MTDTTAAEATNTMMGASADLRHQLDRLVRIVRGAPSLGAAIGWWLGFRLDTRPADPEAPFTDIDVDHVDARRLDIPAGTRVRHRELEVVSAVGDSFLVATVTELLYAPPLGRLDYATRDTIATGTSLIEAAVTPVHRAVCAIQRGNLDDAPESDAVALHASTVLSVGGRPIALTNECVYWRVVTHRAHLSVPAHVLNRRC